MPKESAQKKVGRVRPPRVQVEYEVEIGGAKERKELPFVVGVIADLSGKPEEHLPVLKKRRFVDVDRDNFDKVLAKAKPRLAFQVENTLQKDGTKINVELKFNSLDDFSPEQVAAQVPPLQRLIEARNRLKVLLGKMDGNDRLDSLLQEIVSNTEALQKLSGETGRGGTHTVGDSQ